MKYMTAPITTRPMNINNFSFRFIFITPSNNILHNNQNSLNTVFQFNLVEK